MKKPRWKINSLIMCLGGDHAVHELLPHYGFEQPPVATIAAWRRRNSAGSWELALLYMAVREGLLESLDQIRIVPKEARA